MVGPLSGPISGQMAAFREAVAAIPNALAIDAAFTSPVSVLRYWASLLGAFKRSRGPVYITTSRSLKGFWLRDLPVFVGAALLKRPVVNHLHGSDFLDFQRRARWPTKALINFFYARIPIACVPSPALIDQYAEYISTAVRVIPNFFDPAVLKAPLPKPQDGTIELLYFSNFIHSKGFTTVCDAVRILRNSEVPVSLTLCGEILDSPHMSAAETLAYLAQAEREGVATVRPAVFGKDKVETLGKAHVMILPTRYPTEASPISLIEGLAAGCYVISTDQGSIPDLLEGFEAAIVEASTSEVVESILAYIRRPDRDAIAFHNRSRAVARYSPKRFRRQIKETIDAIACHT